MLGHRDSLVSLGDGGAHCGFICDASLPTFMLAHWTRDRRSGHRFSIPEIVKALSHDNARAVGLVDRGVIAPGAKADLNVIDYDRLQLHAPRVAYDLPAGGRRLLQDATGLSRDDRRGSRYPARRSADRRTAGEIGSRRRGLTAMDGSPSSRPELPPT